MGSLWGIRGEPAENEWVPFGEFVVSPRGIDGFPLGNSWYLGGVSMGDLWSVRGEPTEDFWRMLGDCVEEMWGLSAKKDRATLSVARSGLKTKGLIDKAHRSVC